MNKKNLVIDTNIYEVDDMQPSISSLKANYKQKLESACFLEKQLSIILGKRFIRCWESLKRLAQGQPRQKGSKFLRRERQQKWLGQAGSSETYSWKSLGKKNGLLRSKGQIENQKEMSLKKNSELLGFERARLLKEIVEKLKNVGQSPRKDRENSYVLEKILKMERDLEEIKAQKIIIREGNLRKEMKEEEDKNRQNQAKNSMDEEPRQQEMIKQFLSEIQAIKADILEIRRNNSIIIKNQIQNNFPQTDQPCVLQPNFNTFQRKDLQSTSIILPNNHNPSKYRQLNQGYQSQQNLDPIDKRYLHHQNINTNQFSKSLSYRQHIPKRNNEVIIPITHSNIYTQKEYQQKDEKYYNPSPFVKIGNPLSQHEIAPQLVHSQKTPEKNKKYLNVTYGRNLEDSKKQLKNNVYTTAPTYSSLHTKYSQISNRPNYIHLPRGQNPVYINSGWCYACKRSCACNIINPEK